MSKPFNTLRRAGIASVATTLVLGACVAGAGSASADADFEFTRIAGDDRYETSALTAAAYGASDTVILANGQTGHYADALTANYLSGLKNAPILLTRASQTPDVVEARIAASGAKNVVLVGGTGVISAAQATELDKNYTVTRLAGDDRFGTAAAVIAEGDEAATDTAILATGFNFPDALGGGAVSYAEGMPLAITRPTNVPDNVVAELKTAGITQVIVLGGEDVVGKPVVDELAQKGITLQKRIAGADRAETSALLAQYAIDTLGLSKTGVNVASGYAKGAGADALGGAALAGQKNRPLLITKSNTAAGSGVLTFLHANDATLTEGIIFGGEGAVSSAVESQLTAAARGIESGAINQRTGDVYGDVQAAVDAATAGDTLTVFGGGAATTDKLAAFTVSKNNLTLVGDDAHLDGAITISGADSVTVTGFEIKPSDVGGQFAGIYLTDAATTVISGNVFQGVGNVGAGVINASGGEAEQATISGNEFRDLLQGVFANPTADYSIDSNLFVNNVAGSANDAASDVTNNTFRNNDEGVGLSVAGSTVTGNSFANNGTDHVGDYSADSVYDLAAMILANTFDEAVVVTPTTDTAAPEFIKDAS